MELNKAVQMVSEAVSEYVESMYEDEELMEYGDEMDEAWEIVQDHIKWPIEYA